MSLRVRLVLLILAVVATAAVALSAVELETLVDLLTSDAIERSSLTGQQVSALLRDHIERYAEANPTPQSLAEIKALWNDIVSGDAEFQRLLLQMMASSRSILEINVAGENGIILASSNPTAAKMPMQQHENFDTWGKTRWYRRTFDLLTRRPDWAITLGLGVGDQDRPVFTIQVVTSSVFLRDAIRPQILWLAGVSAGAMGLSLLLTMLAITRALQPVKRIEDTIDRIAQGQSAVQSAEAGDDGLAKEFRVVESKLNLLGQQFQGAREDATAQRHNVDLLLERMASQLDVATRLAAISRLTGGVAHEIKNPLNAIALRLELLRARLGGPDQELSGEIDILSREVHRLDRVVKTFLDFSRPLEVHLQDVDLGGLAREVTEFVTPQARRAEITVDFSAPSAPSNSAASPLASSAPASSAMMRGDSDLLKQAVLNLVTNAMDAMTNTPGGRLGVRVEKARAEQGDEKLVLEVSDNGPGIPAELRDKVFQLYFTTKAKGSGIGLAMTYRAVQLHNGTISFKSDPETGTTFRLEFPATVRHA